MPRNSEQVKHREVRGERTNAGKTSVGQRCAYVGTQRRRGGVGQWRRTGKACLGRMRVESQFPSKVSSRRLSCCLFGAKRERAKESERDTRLHRDKEFLSMSEGLCFRKIHLKGQI